MAQSLRIATWNANGMLKRIQELELFLWDQKIDVCLISETHLNRDSFCKIRGYLIYHTTHPSNNGRGGSAVIVKDNIKHYEESKYETYAMQVIAVNILTKTKNITIAAIYCPPGKKLKNNDYLGLFQMLGDHFIIGGDYNAKHTY